MNSIIPSTSLNYFLDDKINKAIKRTFYSRELHAFSLLSYLERLSIPLMQLLMWLSFETSMKIQLKWFIAENYMNSVIPGTSLNYFVDNKINKAIKRTFYSQELHAFSLTSYLERLSIPLMQLLMWLSFETSMKIWKIHQSMPPRISRRSERQIVRYYIVARCSVPEDSTEKGGKSEEGNSIAVSMIQSSLFSHRCMTAILVEYLQSPTKEEICK